VVKSSAKYGLTAESEPEDFDKIVVRGNAVSIIYLKAFNSISYKKLLKKLIYQGVKFCLGLKAGKKIKKGQTC